MASPFIKPMARQKFNDYPFSYHQELEVSIESITNLGKGVARVPLPEDAEARWVIMVPFTMIGDRVRVRIYKNFSNYSEADLLEVITPAAHRTKPRCKLFGICGGCQYQHILYDDQLVIKRKQVRELLKRMAGIEFNVSPVMGSPREYAYRSKITPHYRLPKWEEGDKDREINPESFPIGFLKQGDRFRMVDVPTCDIATISINKALPKLRKDLYRRAAEGKFRRPGTLLVRHSFTSGEVTTNHQTVLNEIVDGYSFSFLARDFFQNNPFILSQFTQYVRSQAVGGGAKYLVDAYCGSGLFAITSSRSFIKVIGIEVSESSIDFARKNAENSRASNVEFIQGDAASIFEGLSFPSDETAMIIDPPRKGCDQSFLNQLFAYNPKTVVYVSCDPATQVRDLTKFFEKGYELLAVQPFDLFPQTRHLECIMTLRRAG